MNSSDFDTLAKNVYMNTEQINRHLCRAKFASKFLSSGTDADDLPGELLALVKKGEIQPALEVSESDPLDNPSEEEIDTLFDTIRSRSTTAKQQRQGSLKKSAAAPLQQSKFLNETNLIGISTTSLTNSCSDLTGSINKTTILPPKQPPVDVEVLVDRFRQTIRLLGSIENSKIRTVDLAQMRQHFRQTWSSIMKSCREVEKLLDELKQHKDDNETDIVKKEPLISNELEKSMKQLQTKLHYAVFIKRMEGLPDLTKTLSKEVFPLSECLDAIDETIRQKQL